VVHSWADFHHWLITRIVGIRLKVEGLMPPGPVLVAAKHQSMVETIEMLRLVRTPFFVLKRELGDAPLLGRVMCSYGAIPVDREAGAKALRSMLAGSKMALAAKRPVVIFPEGTRVPPGCTPPLQPGFAGLYRALALPVVPVALDTGRLWTRGFLKRSGTMHFVIGEPIPPGLPREEIEAQVHRAINLLEA
jgi:1-acyl-sn-glycerol-3-phosphate acyltransferase